MWLGVSAPRALQDEPELVHVVVAPGTAAPQSPSPPPCSLPQHAHIVINF